MMVEIPIEKIEKLHVIQSSCFWLLDNNLKNKDSLDRAEINRLRTWIQDIHDKLWDIVDDYSDKVNVDKMIHESLNLVDQIEGKWVNGKRIPPEGN